MKMERILITGAIGNIGSVLCPYLENINRSILKIDTIHYFGRDYIMADITQPGDLHRVYDEFSPHIIIHMAAKVSRIDCEKSPVLTVNTNLSGLHNIIQLCLRNNAKLIYFSTSEVYGNLGTNLSEDIEVKPNNLYGLTKYMGEQLVKYYVDNYNLKAVILRPFMIYNEKQKSGEDKAAITRFVYTLMKGEKIRVHKNSTRSWLNIQDAVELINRAMYVDPFEIINIGHPEIIQTINLAKMICDKLSVPYSQIIEEEQPPKMTLRKEPDLTKQKELLQYTPKISVSKGIDMIIQNFKNE